MSTKIVSKYDYQNLELRKKKKSWVYTIIISILFALSVVYLAFAKQIATWGKELPSKTDNPFLQKLLGCVIPIFNTVITVIVVLFLINIIGRLFNISTPKSQKRKTIKKLWESVFRYGLIIVAFFIILSSWGADMSSIAIAGGGIVVFLGLCLKSIVEDFVSGIIIVFEGNVEVGDIITIDSFKGTLREIGIRVTLVENINNDILIINNSSLKKVLNNTKHISKIILKINVPKGITEEKFKSVFEKSISEIKKTCKDIENDISYFGFVSFGRFEVTYAVTYEVYEKRAIQTEFTVRSIIYKYFEQEGLLA